jgi:hypothetical protein
MSVRCSQGHDNPDGSAFCDECGEPLASPAPTIAATIPAAAPIGGAVTTCPSCGSANPAGESFCSNCGANLNAPPAAQPAVAAPPIAPAPSFAPAAPAQQVQAQVVVESDNTTFDLTGKSEALIGREDAVSNVFPDIDLTPHSGEEGGVGRRHARIVYSGSQYMLEDLNSINFTFLNKQKIAPKTPTPLKDGDEIRLGRVVLRFKTP